MLLAHDRKPGDRRGRGLLSTPVQIDTTPTDAIGGDGALPGDSQMPAATLAERVPIMPMPLKDPAQYELPHFSLSRVKNPVEKPQEDERRKNVQRLGGMGGATAAIIGALIDSPALMTAGHAVSTSIGRQYEGDRVEHMEKMRAFYDALRGTEAQNVAIENRETEGNARMQQRGIERRADAARAQQEMLDEARWRREDQEIAERRRQEERQWELGDAETKAERDAETDVLDHQQRLELEGVRQAAITGRSGGGKRTSRYYESALRDTDSEIAEVRRSLSDSSITPSAKRALQGELRDLNKERRDYLRYVGDDYAEPSAPDLTGRVKSEPRSVIRELQRDLALDGVETTNGDEVIEAAYREGRIDQATALALMDAFN